jgi:glycosyltransferase involved in cell wall biosynthesis
LQSTAPVNVHLNNTQLRVAIVAPSLRILGGQSVQAEALLREWAADPEVAAWLVPHNPLPPRLLRWTTRVKFIRTLVTEATYLPLLVTQLQRADVVHIFSASYTSFLLAPLPAMLIARLLGRPVILNYHSGEAPDHLRRSVVARWALARADRIAVPSQFLANVFARYGLKATVVPNILPLDRFAYRRRVPFRPRLLSTRNFEPLYNVECTLRAFGLVQHRFPDASLTLVGAGSEDERLRHSASALGLQNVRFEGRVSPDRIAEYYGSHDIYVQSPNIDNMPLSVLEAMASGLPIVSTDAGGVPTIVTHGKHGLLSPVGDADRLAGSILQLLANPEWSLSLAAAAYDAVQAYSWSNVRDRWIHLYRDVARGAVGSRAAVPV